MVRIFDIEDISETIIKLIDSEKLILLYQVNKYFHNWLLQNIKKVTIIHKNYISLALIKFIIKLPMTSLKLKNNEINSIEVIRLASHFINMSQLRKLKIIKNIVEEKVLFKKSLDLPSEMNLFKSLASLQNLQKLSYSKQDISKIEYLAQSLLIMTQLTSLKITWCNLDSEKVKVLAISLQMLPNLTYLNLKGNYFGSYGANVLAQSLLHMQQLRKLNIGCNAISSGIKPLCESLTSLTNLTKLTCKSNKIYASEITFLAPTLLKLTQLESLNLIWNEFGLQGANLLVPVLAQLPQLRLIKLSYNYIGPKGLSLLTNLVKMKLTCTNEDNIILTN